MFHFTITIPESFIASIFHIVSRFAFEVTFYDIGAENIYAEFSITNKSVAEKAFHALTRFNFPREYQSFDLALTHDGITEYFKIANYRTYVDDITRLIMVN